MKNFFTKNGIILLAAVTVIAVGMCIYTAASSGTGFLHSAIGTIVSPFRYAGNAVVTWFSDIGDHFDSVEELQAENDELRKQISDLEEQLRQNEVASDENVQLRSLLGLSERKRDLTFESARITERGASNWSQTLTISKGTSAGISIGDCVIDQYGYLVGIVTEAGLSWSTVTTILDSSSSIGAEVFRTGDIAVATGDFTLMHSGLLRLDYLQNDSTILNGDQIVTSGLGGYYPSGLVIGTVKEVLTDDGGITRYATITPSCDIDELSEIFIVTDFDVVE